MVKSKVNIDKYPRLTQMPYYNTRVSAERTKLEIITLLEKYGIQSHQWTKFEGKENLKFIIDTVVQGIRIRKAVMFDIPHIKAVYGNKNKIIDIPDKQRYRMFYFAVKSLLEATKYGIIHLDELLLSYVLTQLPSGETVRVKDLLKKHPLLLEQKLGELE